MTPRDRRLRRELVVVVIVKLVIIATLWWAFVRDQDVSVDDRSAANHIVSQVSDSTPQGAPDGQ